jgi:hypothetical protein
MGMALQYGNLLGLETLVALQGRRGRLPIAQVRQLKRQRLGKAWVFAAAS